MLNDEIWKSVPITGLNDFYSVSNTGKVCNENCLVLKTFINNSGYHCLKLHDVNGKRHNWLLHRLVALAFCENPNNYPIINHLDGNKDNCNSLNLVWCTNSQNILHARETGLNPYNTPTLGMKLGGERKGKSDFFGVAYDYSRHKWIGAVTYNKKRHKQKRFDRELEAAQHYNNVCDEMNLTHYPRNHLKA